jgi:hypothetical protein
MTTRAKLGGPPTNSHIIRVDDEVFAHLQKNATALKDSPNAVIRRLLGIDKPGTTEAQTKP